MLALIGAGALHSRLAFPSLRMHECHRVRTQNYRPIRGGHEKPSFRLGGGGRLQNAPSANAFL